METKWMELLNQLHEMNDRELQYVFENSMKISAEREKIRREKEQQEASKAWGELVVAIQDYINKYGSISIGNRNQLLTLTNNDDTNYFTGRAGEIETKF